MAWVLRRSSGWLLTPSRGSSVIVLVLDFGAESGLPSRRAGCSSHCAEAYGRLVFGRRLDRGPMHPSAVPRRVSTRRCAPPVVQSNLVILEAHRVPPSGTPLLVSTVGPGGDVGA